jgi:trans-aconitate methyltransferase
MEESNVNVQASDEVSYNSLLRNKSLLDNRTQGNIQQMCDIIDNQIKRTGKSDLSILEIGFGDGRHFRKLNEIYKDSGFIGLEVRKKPVESMVALGYDCRLVDTELFNGFFKSGEKFDIIYGYGILHHMSDPYKSLESLTGLLNENGVLVFIREAHQFDLLSHLYTTLKRYWAFEKNTFKMNRNRFKKLLCKYSDNYYAIYDNNTLSMCFKRFNSFFCKMKLNRVPFWNGLTIYAQVNKK